MSFTTITYAIFLLLVLVVYWLLGRRSWQNVLLLGASYVFYSWWDYRFAALMLASSLVDFVVGLMLAKPAALGESPDVAKGDTSHLRGSKASRRMLLVVSLAANLGMLGMFKYFNFFADNLVALLNGLGVPVDPVTLRVILPVGISFYTFQTMSYTLDIYFGKLRPTRQIVGYMAYVSFFPQLVAGPIERASHLLPQFLGDRRFNEREARDGVTRIIWGLLKKMAIADNVGWFANAVYAEPEAFGPWALVLATVCFAFQIYCDFSAYSDIARGSAQLLGFDLMRNFAYPYFSRSMGEFWRRWHISLSTWFRDYLYIPLGGSRGSPLVNARNILITFVVSGFWHGANWTFIVWGAINGLGVLWQSWFARGARRTPGEAPGGDSLIPSFRSLVAMLVTFAIACLAWVFFRAESLSDALVVVRGMVGLGEGGRGVGPLLTIAPLQSRFALMLLPCFVLAEWVQRKREHALDLMGLPLAVRWAAYTGVLWVALFLAPVRASEFIYFQF